MEILMFWLGTGLLSVPLWYPEVENIKGRGMTIGGALICLVFGPFSFSYSLIILGSRLLDLVFGSERFRRFLNKRF